MSENRLTLVKSKVTKLGTNWASEYMCSCGNTIVARDTEVRTGATKSCGCLRKDVTTNRSTKHGYHKEQLYILWSGMKQRCNNPRCDGYKNYGARGIKICEEWTDYLVFREWALTNGYQPFLTIERNNNNLGYEPSNCRWIPQSEQSKNRRTNIPTEVRKAIKTDSESMSYAQLIDKYNVSHYTITKIKKEQ